MPTENRSTDQEKVSQLEMAHVVRASLQVPGMPVLTSNQCYLLAQVLNKNLAPAQQGESESVGWQFYQQGRWWNGDDRIKDHRKNTEEAGIPTRDVFARPVLGQGESVVLPERKDPTQGWAVPGGVAKADGWNEYHDEIAKLGQLYTHAEPDEVERLRTNLEMARRERNNYLGWCRDARGEAIQLRAQLAEAQALLREIADHCNGCVMPTEQLLRDWGSSIDAHLSASAEPSAPLPPVDGDLLPPINSKVLIHLGRVDKWVEHTVVGYYAWGNHGLDQNVHRVFVRVRDAEGYLNARLLNDIRPVTLERKPWSPGACSAAWPCSGCRFRS